MISTVMYYCLYIQKSNLIQIDDQTQDKNLGGRVRKTVVMPKL